VPPPPLSVSFTLLTKLPFQGAREGGGFRGVEERSITEGNLNQSGKGVGVVHPRSSANQRGISI